MPRTSTRISAVLGLSTTLGLAAATPALAAKSTTSHFTAAGLLSTSVSAANEAGSMEFFDTTVVGKSTEKLQGAVSAPTAAEYLTSPTGTLKVELTGSVVYVIGNAASLESALQISTAQATAASGKWISVQPSDAPFQLLTSALTIDSSLDEFTPTTHLKLEKIRTVDGQRVYPVVGNTTAQNGVAGAAALFVSAKGLHLPVGGTLVLVHGKSRLQEVSAFTHWGAKVSVTAPTAAETFSSVLAS